MTTVHASVFVALFNASDPAHNQVVAWLRSAIADAEPLRAPVTVLAEVAALVSSGTGDKQMGRDVASQVRHSALFELLPVALPLAERAATIAAEHRFSGSDSLYFAVAETLADRLVTLHPDHLARGNALVETAGPRTR
ncbi:MAG: PIN domain-containing protein [Anaerolineaceae bacterium]